MRSCLIVAVLSRISEDQLAGQEALIQMRESVQAIEQKAKAHLAELQERAGPSSFLESDPDGLPPMHLDLDEKKDAEMEVETGFASLLGKVKSLDAQEDQEVGKTLQDVSKLEAESKKPISLLQTDSLPGFDKDMALAKRLKELELDTQAKLERLKTDGSKVSLLQTSDSHPFAEPKGRMANDQSIFAKADRKSQRDDKLELALEAQLQRDFPRPKHDEVAAGTAPAAPASFIETGAKASHPFAEPKGRMANDQSIFAKADRESQRDDKLELALEAQLQRDFPRPKHDDVVAGSKAPASFVQEQPEHKKHLLVNQLIDKAMDSLNGDWAKVKAKSMKDLQAMGNLKDFGQFSDEDLEKHPMAEPVVPPQAPKEEEDEQEPEQAEEEDTPEEEAQEAAAFQQLTHQQAEVHQEKAHHTHHKKAHHKHHKHHKKHHHHGSLLETADERDAPWIDHAKVDRVFSDLSDQLEQITGKTKQTLSALQGEAEAAAHPDTYVASSFLEEGQGVGAHLVGIDAAYKALDAQLAQVKAELTSKAPPSSFVEYDASVQKAKDDVNGFFSDIDKKLDAWHAQTKQRLQKTRDLEDQLHVDPTDPSSSFVQAGRGMPAPDEDTSTPEDLERRLKAFERHARQLTPEQQPASLLEKHRGRGAPQDVMQSEYAQQMAAKYAASWGSGFDSGFARQEAMDVSNGKPSLEQASRPLTAPAPSGRPAAAYGQDAQQYEYGNFAKNFGFGDASENQNFYSLAQLRKH